MFEWRSMTLHRTADGKEIVILYGMSPVFFMRMKVKVLAGIC